MFDWFNDYLTNRQQTVISNGQSSDLRTIEAGVPQGSILDPLMFLIYINDIVRDIRANIRLFADDNSVSILVNNTNEASDILNDDLMKIDTWAKRWLVTFNPNKTEFMIFSRKTNKPFHPPLIMQNQQLNENYIKRLGDIL